MALTQPTYTYNAQVTLLFSYGSGWSFEIFVPDSQVSALTDTQLTDAINNMMAQLNVMWPGAAVSCDVNWSNNGSPTTPTHFTFTA